MHIIRILLKNRTLQKVIYNNLIMDHQLRELFEDELDVLQIIDYGFPRINYTRSNYFHTRAEFNFYKRFRLTQQTCLRVLPYIEELEFPNNKNNSISPMKQFLTAIRFYACAGHLVTVADFSGMYLSTASRIVTRISQALAGIKQLFIKMPETAVEIQEIQNQFFEIAAFPRVVSVIDGAHIRIQSPGGNDAETFRNRKSYFSLNIQVVASADLKIFDIVVWWPGFSHDSIIFNNSRIRAKMENGDFPNSILLGDSGYPLRSHFLTPLADPRTATEQLYNEAHIRTQNTVERLFGNWKRRFPVLAYGLRLKLDTIVAVIIATAVLQNIAREMHDLEPPPLPEDINVKKLNKHIRNGNIPHLADNNNLN